MKDNTWHAPFWIGTFGLLATLFTYRYGIYDQIEQLPIILGMMEDDYLARDFFVNASTGFGPRFYYAHFIAFFAQILGLPLTLFLFTLAAHLGISWVSFRGGQRLFPDLPQAGLMSSAFAMSLSTLELGSDLSIYSAYLTPGLLVTPLILFALWKGWERKYLEASFATGLASLFHVLYGLETAVLILGSGLFLMVIQRDFRKWPSLLLGSLLLVAFALPTLLPYLQQPKVLDDRDFIDIIAYFRHPHHYLPSYFLSWKESRSNLLVMGIWVALAFYCLNRRKAVEDFYDREGRWIRIFFILLLLSSFMGWLMVEVMPSRLFTTAQLWRLLNLFKWIFLLLLAGSLSRHLSREVGWKLIALILLMQDPYLVVFAFFYLERQREGEAPLLDLALGLLSLLALVLAFMSLPIANVLLLLSLSFLLILILKGKGFLARGLVLAMILFAFAQLSFLPALIPQSLRPYSDKVLRPQIFELSYPEEVEAFGNYVKKELPQDAIILVPPKFGGLRIAGRRAIVADFKAFPFGDEAILEWRERIGLCFGEIGAFQAGSRLDSLQQNHYESLDEKDLASLRQTYPFDFAILPRSRTFTYPSLFTYGRYRLLDLRSDN